MSLHRKGQVIKLYVYRIYLFMKDNSAMSCIDHRMRFSSHRVLTRQATGKPDTPLEKLRFFKWRVWFSVRRCKRQILMRRGEAQPQRDEEYANQLVKQKIFYKFCCKNDLFSLVQHNNTILFRPTRSSLLAFSIHSNACCPRHLESLGQQFLAKTKMLRNRRYLTFE